MSDINTETSGSVLRIEFNRPARKNAMTADMCTTMAGILTKADQNDDVRVVLWHSAGDSFCAGIDVQDFLKNPPRPSGSPQADLMEAFVRLAKPVVAAVQGAAIANGTTMLTQCDFVCAGASAKFQMPFIDLALVPEFGSTFSIPARIGHLRAAELFLLGERFTAQRAAELGLVTRVVPDADLQAAAEATARKLASKAPGALLACKQLIKRSSIPALREAIAAEWAEFTARVTSADSKEAFSAFLEKRPPNFNQTKTRVAAE